MKLRAFTYLLLLIMTIPSLISLVDIHTLHQSGAEHLAYDDHQHINAEPHAVSDGLINSENPDCDHCCHCHGHSPLAILSVLDGVYSRNSAIQMPNYFDKAFPDTFETFLRPPIT